MTAIRIYGFLVSTWTRTVCMTCIEKGLDHELVPLDYGSDEHEAIHPFRRIPTVEIDGRRIIEGLAITGHLDEAFPGPSLQPTEPEDRLRMRTWMSVCGDYLFRDVVRTIPRDRAPTNEELATALTALQRAESLVEGDPFLAGSELTLADLYLAPQIANCREKAPQLLEGLDAINGWAPEVESRESFRLTAYDPPG